MVVVMPGAVAPGFFVGYERGGDRIYLACELNCKIPSKEHLSVSEI